MDKIINDLQEIINSTDLSDQSIGHAELIVDSLSTIYTYDYQNKIMIRNLAKRNDISSRKTLVDIKAKELINYFKQLLDLSKPNIVQTSEPDYTQPLISLLSYKIGAFNNYDTDLINYCKKLDLDTGIILAIYFAERKEDIISILEIYAPNNRSAVTKIRLLKKLSAEKKFRENYGITSDHHIQMLIEKKSLFSSPIANNHLV